MAQLVHLQHRIPLVSQVEQGLGRIQRPTIKLGRIEPVMIDCRRGKDRADSTWLGGPVSQDKALHLASRQQMQCTADRPRTVAVADQADMMLYRQIGNQPTEIQSGKTAPLAQDPDIHLRHGREDEIARDDRERTGTSPGKDHYVQGSLRFH